MKFKPKAMLKLPELKFYSLNLNFECPKRIFETDMGQYRDIHSTAAGVVVLMTQPLTSTPRSVFFLNDLRVLCIVLCKYFFLKYCSHLFRVTSIGKNGNQVWIHVLLLQNCTFLDFWALCFVVVFMIEGTWLYSHRENKQCIMTQCVSSASTKMLDYIYAYC